MEHKVQSVMTVPRELQAQEHKEQQALMAHRAPTD
jgi:hypothetical protein